MLNKIRFNETLSILEEHLSSQPNFIHNSGISPVQTVIFWFTKYHVLQLNLLIPFSESRSHLTKPKAAPLNRKIGLENVPMKRVKSSEGKVTQLDRKPLRRTGKCSTEKDKIVERENYFIQNLLFVNYSAKCHPYVKQNQVLVL